MKSFVKDKIKLDNLLGILYMIASVLYIFNAVIPFGFVMAAIIILLLINWPSRNRENQKTGFFDLRTSGMIMLALVLLIKNIRF